MIESGWFERKSENEALKALINLFVLNELRIVNIVNIWIFKKWMISFLEKSNKLQMIKKVLKFHDFQMYSFQYQTHANFVDNCGIKV
jgi:hypothetical protein